MNKLILSLTFLALFPKLGMSSTGVFYTCNLEREKQSLEKRAQEYLKKIQSIEPKYKNIRWSISLDPGPYCAVYAKVIDGVNACTFTCDATHFNNSGLKMHFSQKGELIGFDYYSEKD